MKKKKTNRMLPPSPLLRKQNQLTLAGAKLILEAAEAKAREINVDMDIAVVDAGGHLLAFHRMDGAKLTSIDIAINKAFTSACTRLPTHQYAEVAGPGKPAFGIHVSNQGRFMIFGGGLPIVVDGETVGAVGCSSGSPDQDRAVAQTGIDALLEAIAK
jgi:uncharacterized protein GlcG (DUF336 family)